jgi:hypothetical protein
VDLIPKIAHFVILTPTGNYRFLKFKSVKNNPFWAIYACGVEARPWRRGICDFASDSSSPSRYDVDLLQK